jgi:hypothetical protein
MTRNPTRSEPERPETRDDPILNNPTRPDFKIFKYDRATIRSDISYLGYSIVSVVYKQR